MAQILKPLRTLEDKRQFIKDLRIGSEGSRILYLRNEAGEDIPIDEASEIQIDQVLEILGTRQ